MEILLLILIVAGFVLLIAGPRVSKSSRRPRRYSGSSNSYIYPGSSSSSDYGSSGGDYGGSSGSDCGSSSSGDYGGSSCGDSSGGGASGGY